MRDMVITIAYIFNIFRMTDLRVSRCLVEYYFRVLFTLLVAQSRIENSAC